MSFLYDQSGKRKYLTVDERQAFLNAAKFSDRDVYTFCAMLAYTGARISEILALTVDHINFSESVVVIECLKKREKGVYRTVPIPEHFIFLLDEVHAIRSRQSDPGMRQEVLWPWCRTTAWKRVKRLMCAAGIYGPHASPKGLRHGFAVNAIQMAMPLNLVRRWLGHSRLSTTAIYADAVGEEERNIARKFWSSFE